MGTNCGRVLSEVRRVWDMSQVYRVARSPGESDESVQERQRKVYENIDFTSHLVLGPSLAEEWVDKNFPYDESVYEDPLRR